MTILILPNLISNFEFDFEYVLILLSCVFGISGFIGLLTLFNINKIVNHILTIILLTSGMLGSVIFISTTGGQKAWKWILTFEEPDEWFIFMWPNIVALVFTIILARQYQTKKSTKS